MEATAVIQVRVSGPESWFRRYDWILDVCF